MMSKTVPVVLLALLPALSRAACEVSIAVNQVGYLPDAPKVCRCEKPPAPDYAIFTIGTDVVWRCVRRGAWRPVRPDAKAVEADFSDLRAPGDYLILSGTNVAETVPCWIPDECAEARSLYFVIRTNVYDTVERTFLNYYTWQRCGSKKGWAGLCHQDRCPLVGTDRTIDVRGGYHQSCDLRNWGDGISSSVYALLRYAETARPLWDGGEVRDEVRWGCDYFLKLVGPEGYAYDAQFTPIGWGPRRYYVVPAAFGAQANIAMLLARASVCFKDDAAYSARLVATARRVFDQMETNPFFDRARPSPEPDLPAGAQPAERFYPQNFRTSATGFAGRAMAALELYRATDEARYAELAQQYGRELLSLQVTEGENAGAYRFHASTNALGFADCSYTHMLHGERTPLELYRTFGGDAWRTAALRTAERIKATLAKQDMLPGAPKTGGAAQTAGRWAILLLDCADLFGRDDLRPYAQRTLDWIYGSNPDLTSFIEGVGHNQRQRSVFGQFFPSTPQVPGAVQHVKWGEYDMPAVGMMLWATHRLGERVACEPARAAGAEILETRPICIEKGRYIGWPTVCRRANGELLVVFSGDRDQHVCPWGKVQLIRSADNGRTWSEPVTIQNGILDDRDAGLVELRDGTLLLNWFTSVAYYVWNRAAPEDRACGAEYVRHFESLPREQVRAALGSWASRSTDGGLTWSKPVRTPGQLPHGVTELRSGRIVAVARKMSGEGQVLRDEPGFDRIGHHILCEESCDGGRSWRTIGELEPGEGVQAKDLHEPHLVELDDGRLLTQVRWHGAPTTNRWGGLVQAVSADGGRTWTKMERTPIVGFPPHLLKLADGRLVTVYGNRNRDCWGEYASLSEDGGRTWKDEVCLSRHFNGDLGYPSSVQLADGTVVTVYYQAPQQGEPPAVMMTRWRPPPMGGRR